MDRRLQITLLVLTLIFQSVQVGAFVSSIELPTYHATETNSTTDIAPCHQLEQASSKDACGSCDGQAQCGNVCVTSCASGTTAFISQLQVWLTPAVAFIVKLDSTDSVSAGIHIPIYHPPIRS
ncbi:MAG: hypothetical protein V7459_02950 [Oceanicoccus sp.]